MSEANSSGLTASQELWRLLTPRLRRSAFVLLGLTFIVMVLETLGIGLVIPALALMSENKLGVRYPALVPLLSSLGNPSREQLAIGGMLTLVGVYAFKAAFVTFFVWMQSLFVLQLQVNLSQRLFSGYLRQPYAFHLQRNSVQLINYFNYLGHIVTVIQSDLTLITEFLVLLGISALLLKVEPLGALLVVSTVGFVSWGFHRLVRRRLLRWGEAFQLHDRLRLQHLQHGLGGVKDVKLLGREDDFIDQFHFHTTGFARIMQRQKVLQALPRLSMELLAIVGLAALVIVMIGQGKPMEDVVPTLGLFAAAAFRIMPSANRILGAVQEVRFSSPVVNTLYSEFHLLERNQAPQHNQPLLLRTALTLDQVSFNYPSAETSALRGISLSISRGTSVGFIGGSGAGKSTLVDIILGLLTPVSGTVKVDGIDIQNQMRGWQDQIGYVPQTIYLTDDTLRRNVAFGLPTDQIDEAAVWRAVRAARLEQFVNELPQGLETVVGERGVRLSGGQRQRIGIARALYHDPPVLVLDEATSSLDTATERGVMDAVRALRGNKTLLIVAHRISTVEHCDRLFRLEHGRVVEEGETAVVLGNVPVVLPAKHG